MAVKKTAKHWGLFVICVVLGTLIGIFFQQFSVTAPIFHDFVNPRVDIREIDLIAFSFSTSFSMRFNLGTFFGGIVGLWITQ